VPPPPAFGAETGIRDEPSPFAVWKVEFISQFSISLGKIIRGPAGVVLFCGGEKMIQPAFSGAAASRCRFAPAITMPGGGRKKGLSFSRISLNFTVNGTLWC
jgi:hypothetical protein